MLFLFHYPSLTNWTIYTFCYSYRDKSSPYSYWEEMVLTRLFRSSCCSLHRVLTIEKREKVREECCVSSPRPTSLLSLLSLFNLFNKGRKSITNYPLSITLNESLQPWFFSDLFFIQILEAASHMFAYWKNVSRLSVYCRQWLHIGSSR